MTGVANQHLTISDNYSSSFFLKGLNLSTTNTIINHHAMVNIASKNSVIWPSSIIFSLAPVEGIEPPSTGLEAVVFPLDDTDVKGEFHPLIIIF